MNAISNSVSLKPQPIMDDLIKQSVGSATLEDTGSSASGFISTGNVYNTDAGTIFVKRNKGNFVSYFKFFLSVLRNHVKASSRKKYDFKARSSIIIFLCRLTRCSVENLNL